MVRTSVIHSVAPGATFLFLTHFDAVCDLSRECRVYILLDVIMRRRMATWNLFINPLTPIRDQYRISPYGINTISSRQVMRIKKNIILGIRS